MPCGRIALLLGALGFAACVHAADVLVVLSDTSSPYQQATKALSNALDQERGTPTTVESVDVGHWAQRPAAGRGGERVVVALGQRACQAVSARNAVVPLLCTLIPRASFQTIVTTSGRKTSNQFSAVYLSQPLARQLTLLRLALPKAQKVGVLWSAGSASQLEVLRGLAQEQGLQLVDAQVDADPASLFPALRDVLGSADVLLALPDASVYNTHTLQNILLACLRAGIPMQAFAANYVQAGALLALYVTPEQEGRRAALAVRDVLTGRSLPSEPIYVDDFEVGVNAHVARSLGLDLDAERLHQRLRQREGLK